jgi:multidrug efflux pump subunit AcrA (membrane-fusion protein)
MIGKYLLPILAVTGFAVAIGAVIEGNQTAPAAPPLIPPARVAFPSYIAGAGIIEARSQNIAIGTPVSGIVTAINVKWGDWANPGDILFRIDDRVLQGQLLVAKAKTDEAEAALAKARNFLEFGEGLRVDSSITRLDMMNRRFDAQISEAAVGSAKAFVEQTEIEIERRTIRAPVPGRILQIGIRLGEFAQSGVVNPPLMVLGDDTRLHVRVDIDENDAWRLTPSAPAMLVVRGNPDLTASLRFERIEPYIIPKPVLTGQGTERPDVRVLQVIYSFDRGALPVYIGQQVDVYVGTATVGVANVTAGVPSVPKP